MLTCELHINYKIRQKSSRFDTLNGKRIRESILWPPGICLLNKRRINRTYVWIGVASSHVFRSLLIPRSIEGLVIEEPQLLTNNRHWKGRPGIEPMSQIVDLLVQLFHYLSGAIVAVEIHSILEDVSQQKSLSRNKSRMAIEDTSRLRGRVLRAKRGRRRRHWSRSRAHRSTHVGARRHHQRLETLELPHRFGS